MELERAFKRLLIKSPFYGLFCLSLPKKVTKDISTLCVARKGINCELQVNPEFWETLSDDEQIAVIEHELSHICFQHILMSDSFPNKELFNVAADCEVNSYIRNIPEGCVFPTTFGLPVEKGTKFYYEELQKKFPPSSSGSGEGEDNGGYPQAMEGYGVKTIDDHSNWDKEFKNLPDATKQLVQNNINSILRNTAEQVEKQHGTIPAGLSEIIEKLRQKKPEIFNWKAYFRRMLGSIYDVNIKSTRRKQSRRFEGAAGIQHRKKVSILVAVDTSGSVATEELRDFFSEIEYIYKAGARVTLIECDARINKIVEYDGKRIPEIVGRGGTDFQPPVDYYRKHRKEYASLIYFTDGYANIPEDAPAGLVWIITSNGCRQEYPGKAIFIPKEYGNN